MELNQEQREALRALPDTLDALMNQTLKLVDELEKTEAAIANMDVLSDTDFRRATRDALVTAFVGQRALINAIATQNTVFATLSMRMFGGLQ